MSSSGPKSSVIGRQPWGYTIISDILYDGRDQIILKYHPHSKKINKYKRKLYKYSQ